MKALFKTKRDCIKKSFYKIDCNLNVTKSNCF